MKEEVLTFESPKEHYQAEVFILWCFDQRFDALLHEFKQRFKNPDFIKWAGGAKGLAEDGPDRPRILHQMELFRKLHRTKGIVLMMHSGCGAYGTFVDPSAEFAHHASELEQAVRAIQ